MPQIDCHLYLMVASLSSYIIFVGLEKILDFNFVKFNTDKSKLNCLNIKKLTISEVYSV